MKKVTPFSLLSTASAFIVAASLSFPSVSTAQRIQPLLAKVEPVLSAPLVPTVSIDVQGSRALLVASRETILVSPMVGRIERIHGDMGSYFRQGATLVEFDCKEFHAKLRMAEAEYNAAQQGHEGKLRLQGLEAAGELEVATAAAMMEKAKAQIELNKIQIQQCKIEAPFAGRIVKMAVKQHQGVNVGQSMLEVVSAGMPKVRVNAPSKWLVWLRPGMQFQLHIDETGKTYTAEVASLNGRVDAASQSIEIEARLKGNNPELLAGMSGNARFVSK